MSTILQDVRYAWRNLRRTPGFALVAILTLTLGIGANTTIFSVVHGLLLAPLPYPAPDRLVTLWQDMRATGGPAKEWATPGNFVDWKSQSDVFTSVTVVRGWSASLTTGGPAEAVVGEQVTHEYLDVLATQPALGRAFTAEDDVPNAGRVAILSHSLWARRFGAQASAIGKVIDLGGEPHEIVGVMPAGFRPGILPDAEIWRPMRLNTASPNRGAVVLRAIGRLQPSVSLVQASTRLSELARRLEQQYPESNAQVGFNVIPLHEHIVGDVRPALLAIVGAVGFVLLIACVNIANLLLARASGRSREIAVRLALGASRGRIVRQLLTESLALAAIGGAGGVLLAAWGVPALMAIAPASVPRVAAIAVDAPVLVFTLGLSVVTGILFGLLPAWQASRSSLTPALNEGGRGAVSPSGQLARRMLIVAEVALALMLLVGGGLLVRTFTSLRSTDLGFDPSGVIAGYVQPPAKYATRPQLATLYDRLLEGARALPGASNAALSSVIPLGGDSDTNFAIEGRPLPPNDSAQPVAWYRLVSASYFDVMRIPLRKGHLFAAGETQPVVVINETMAQKFWPGEDPIGRRIRGNPDQPWITVVGIVGDIHARGARRAGQPEMYSPYWQIVERGTNIVVRTQGDPASLTGAMRRMVAGVEPTMPVATLQPMTATVAESLDQPRFFALLSALFAALALALAGIGVYGVMAHSVASRSSEIGVRVALGASRSRILKLVVGDALRLTAAGLVVGTLGALAVGRALEQLLFGVGAADPVTFAATIATLLAVSAIASYLPARRALHVDPVEALRR